MTARTPFTPTRGTRSFGPSGGNNHPSLLSSPLGSTLPPLLSPSSVLHEQNNQTSGSSNSLPWSAFSTGDAAAVSAQLDAATIPPGGPGGKWVDDQTMSNYYSWSSNLWGKRKRAVRASAGAFGLFVIVLCSLFALSTSLLWSSDSTASSSSSSSSSSSGASSVGTNGFHHHHQQQYQDQGRSMTEEFSWIYSLLWSFLYGIEAALVLGWTAREGWLRQEALAQQLPATSSSKALLRLLTPSGLRYVAAHGITVVALTSIWNSVHDVWQATIALPWEGPGLVMECPFDHLTWCLNGPGLLTITYSMTIGIIWAAFTELSAGNHILKLPHVHPGRWWAFKQAFPSTLSSALRSGLAAGVLATIFAATATPFLTQITARSVGLLLNSPVLIPVNSTSVLMQWSSIPLKAIGTSMLALFVHILFGAIHSATRVSLTAPLPLLGSATGGPPEARLRTLLAALSDDKNKLTQRLAYQALGALPDLSPDVRASVFSDPSGHSWVAVVALAAAPVRKWITRVEKAAGKALHISKPSVSKEATPSSVVYDPNAPSLYASTPAEMYAGVQPPPSITSSSKSLFFPHPGLYDHRNKDVWWNKVTADAIATTKNSIKKVKRALPGFLGGGKSTSAKSGVRSPSASTPHPGVLSAPSPVMGLGASSVGPGASNVSVTGRSALSRPPRRRVGVNAGAEETPTKATTSDQAAAPPASAMSASSAYFNAGTSKSSNAEPDRVAEVVTRVIRLARRVSEGIQTGSKIGDSVRPWLGLSPGKGGKSGSASQMREVMGVEADSVEAGLRALAGFLVASLEDDAAGRVQPVLQPVLSLMLEASLLLNAYVGSGVPWVRDIGGTSVLVANAKPGPGWPQPWIFEQQAVDRLPLVMSSTLHSCIYRVVTSFYEHLSALAFAPPHAAKLQTYVDFCE